MDLSRDSRINSRNSQKRNGTWIGFLLFGHGGTRLRSLCDVATCDKDFNLTQQSIKAISPRVKECPNTFWTLELLNTGGGSPERGVCDENSNGRVTLPVRAHNNHYDHLSITNGKVSNEAEVRTVLTILRCVQC